jgi:hypothetical protein
MNLKLCFSILTKSDLVNQLKIILDSESYKTENEKMKPRLITVGGAGLDLELEDIVKKSGVKLEGDRVSLPQYVLVNDKRSYHLGQIDAPSESGLVQIDLDGSKKDFKTRRTFKNQEEVLEHLNGLFSQEYVTLDDAIEGLQGRVLVGNAEANLGQGALNAAYAAAIFRQGVRKNLQLDIAIVSLYGNATVENELKELGIENCVVSEKDGVPINVNRHLTQKLTLRSPEPPYLGEEIRKGHILDNLHKEDAIFIDSVKDGAYAALLLEKLAAAKSRNELPHVYISVTDSMFKKLDTGVINRLLSYSEVYIARLEELELLSGIKVKQEKDNEGNVTVSLYEKLHEAMHITRDRMKQDGNGGKLKPRIYVTNDAGGAYVHDREHKICYHPVAKLSDPLGDKVVNTSGCGDAFAAVAVYLELLRTNDLINTKTNQILGYASIAGQINAHLPTTCGDEMANPSRINEFLVENPEVREIRQYNGFNFGEKCEILHNMEMI